MGLKRPDKRQPITTTNSSTVKKAVTTPGKKKRPAQKVVEPSNAQEPTRKKKPAGAVKPTKPKVVDGDKKVGRAQLMRMSDNSAYAMAFANSMNGMAGDKMIMPKTGKLFTNLILPIPLVLQCIAQINGIPYSAAIEIVGDKGSNKTALLLDLANAINGRHYYNPDSIGFMDYMSAETKLPDKMILAMCGYPDEEQEERPHALKAVNPFQCDGMDVWQTTAMNRAKVYKKLVDPRRAIPYMLGIDSLSAKLMAETSDKIEATGIPGRQHSFEAQAIKKWLQAYQRAMEGWPYIVAAINHVARDKQMNSPAMTRVKPGGRYYSYLESLDFDLKKVGKSLTTRPDFETPVPKVVTNTIEIKIEKNSCGETGDRCYGYVQWFYTMPKPHHINPDSPRQRMRWLWGRSLVEKLDVTSDRCNLSKEAKDVLRDICHVVCVNKSANIYKCTQLPESRAGLPAEELGQMIETDPKLKLAIQQFYGVTHYDKFEPLTDYAAISAVQRKEKAKKDAEGDIVD